MPLAERRRRWTALMDGVRRDDVVAWREQFLCALRDSRAAAGPPAPRDDGALRNVA